MKTITKPLPQPHRIQIIEEDRKYLEERLEAAWQKVKNSLEFPGFRKGEVPRSIAEKKLTVEVLYKPALDEILQKGLLESKLSAFQVTEVTVEWFDEKQPLILSAIVLLQPNVVACDYKTVKVDYEKLTVTDAEIQTTLTRIALGEADEVEVDTAISASSWANVSFTFTDKEGKLYASQKELLMKPSKVIYGFEPTMIGQAKGYTHEFTLTLPKDFFDKPMQGKQVYCSYTINKVIEVHIPEINEDLAKKVGFESLAEMKNKIAVDLAKEKNKADEVLYRDALLSAVISKTEFTPIPDRMVTDELDLLLNKNIEDVNKQHKTALTETKALEQLGFSSKQQWYATQWMRGLRKVQMNLMLDHIATCEGFVASDEDVQKELDLLFPTKPENLQIDMNALRVYVVRKKTQEMLVSQVQKK